ncbi:MAG: homoserine dehydrogenase [Deltaproteobacteria bacterium RBG_13_65_10]|nr:MAG: homoserine dehydrogenase [Deltaproteobacteria bacterium RBG_13_65_10]
MKSVGVGLVGFGTIGTGVVKLLRDHATLIRDRAQVGLILRRVADIDLGRDRGVSLEKGLLIADYRKLLEEEGIDIVIELIGGTTVAREVVLAAIERGRHVVTANKALLATHGKEIFDAAEKRGVEIRFEGSVGGGIPIIRAIQEGFAADRIESVHGIVNGTSNYILSKMTAEGQPFDEVLKKAQAKGLAEADPTYDIDGTDAAHKLAILCALAFGYYVDLDHIHREGIDKIAPIDIDFAREFGLRIKLLAIAREHDGVIEARVHPTMIPAEHLLATVDGAFNAIYVHGEAVGSSMLYGVGAGMMPTATAVVSDVMDIARGILRNAPRRGTALSVHNRFLDSAHFRPMDDIENHFYLRFTVLDRPGVLSRIAGALGERGISIESVIQKGREHMKSVPIVIVTHAAPEKNLRAALAEIDALDVVKAPTRMIRIEPDLH